ncbi:MAG: DoxX family protein [Hyphomonadaceae bacterium]
MDEYAQAVGRVVLGLGVLGIGAISLIFADFAITWQPVPDWVPARTALAYASGALMTAAGVAFIFNRFTAIAAAFVSAFMCLWAFVLQPPRLLAGVEAAWLAPAEILAVAAGAWVLFWLTSAETSFRERAIRLGVAFFGLMPLVFGIAHFLYIDFTASFIPAWMPWRVFWAWFTGFGHVAAGLSIVLGIMPRIGSTLLAIMFSGFVVLVHIPRIAADAGNRLEWHLLSTALLLTSAGWIVAATCWRKR